MKETIIKMKKLGALNKPIAIVGLPGVGNVGKIVAEHLRKELKAERIGVIYSPHFPHQAIMLKNGRVRLVSNSLYLAKAKSAKGNDLVILTGDVQAFTPEGQYEINSKILDLLKNKLGCSFVYTIGGYNVGEPLPQGDRRVFGNATSKAVIAKFNKTNIIFGKTTGMIWGSAGLIIAFARMQHFDGACIMGETSMLDFDASAAKSVIVELSKILNLNIGTVTLDKIIKQTEQAIRQIQLEQNQMGIQTPMGGAPGGEALPHPERSPSYIR